MSGCGTQWCSESKNYSHNIVIPNSFVAADEDSKEYLSDSTRIDPLKMTAW